MRRREFLTLIGGGAAAWPLVARAQQSEKIPTIGFLCPTAPEKWAIWTKAFVERLAELGWIEGRTIEIAYRWGYGHTERFGALAAELVALKANLILTAGSATLQTMKQTSEIPIVFALASEPVATGMVASLPRPGGNVTGLSLEAPELAGKRVELLRTVTPAARRIAVLADVAYPASVLELGQAKDAIAAAGLEFIPLQIKQAEEIQPAFAGLKERADALYVCSADPLINNVRDQINTLALAAGLPTLYGERPYVEAGGLICYGAKVPVMFRRAAEIADRILKGAKPADIPVEQPTAFELVINLKTAKALGLTIPPNMLALADEVIE